MLPTPVFLGFPGSSAGKKSACNVGDLGLIASCLAVHTALFAEPRGDKARAERLEESSGSRRDYRHVYSLLAGTAAIAADIT